ncbi:hypothetical protein LRU_01330 [Ligilactobacillus ruminis SPM0211]|uniref:Uncharacterized protein n=1 Tax=Ligilactobacillus ruminis SPM0211 TaxID=1040964 RepID=F7R0X3_9LACO|nr:hypothetical protein LRU_01330 [Ligilactobacillus ruminis SPM0211]
MSEVPSQRRSLIKVLMLFAEFKKFPQFIGNFRAMLTSVL